MRLVCKSTVLPMTFTMSVLAKPGTPMSRQWPRANKATNIWFSVSF